MKQSLVILVGVLVMVLVSIPQEKPPETKPKKTYVSDSTKVAIARGRLREAEKRLSGLEADYQRRYDSERAALVLLINQLREIVNDSTAQK